MKRSVVAIAVSLGLLGLTGCFNSLQDDAGVQSQQGGGGCVGAGCHHGIGGGSGDGSQGGSSSGGSGSSSGSTSVASSSGSSSGGSASGSSQGGSSSSGGIGDAGYDCPDFYVASSVFDLATKEPIPGATIAAVGLNNAPIPGAAASAAVVGTFVMCVPANVDLSVQISAPGYPESVLEDFVMTSESEGTFFTKGIPLLSSEDLTVLMADVPYNPALGAVLISVNSLSGNPPCQDASGFVLSVGFPDGGALPDGGTALPFSRVYLGNSFLPDPSLTLTEANGDALLYDIDPNLTNLVTLQAVNTNPDAGECPIISAQVGFQSTAPIGTQILTFAPMILP